MSQEFGKFRLLTKKSRCLLHQDYQQAKALAYKTLFEELVQNDLEIFEERRLQDVLLCKAQAPSFSVKDQDFTSLWEQRLTELQDRRSLYLQVSSNILSLFRGNTGSLKI